MFYCQIHIGFPSETVGSKIFSHFYILLIPAADAFFYPPGAVSASRAHPGKLCRLIGGNTCVNNLLNVSIHNLIQFI